MKTTAGLTGSPLLADCRAAFEGRVLQKIEIGDRLCIWADVVAGTIPGGAVSPGEKPLTEKALLATASEDQKSLLRTRLEQDIDWERLAWRSLRLK